MKTTLYYSITPPSIFKLLDNILQNFILLQK